MPEAPYGRSNCWLTVILITPEEFGVDREVAAKSIWKRRLKEMVYNGPRNLDRVICYTWERKRGGPSGEFEEAASAVV
jgi:hypothetical protein